MVNTTKPTGQIRIPALIEWAKFINEDIEQNISTKFVNDGIAVGFSSSPDLFQKNITNYVEDESPSISGSGSAKSSTSRSTAVKTCTQGFLNVITDAVEVCLQE